MPVVNTYTQEQKKEVRHAVIRRAVELLTYARSNACCVRRSYVRDLYDHFSQMSESHEQVEAQRIDTAYICEWEKMHANEIGSKRPSELSVCYLAGPEPRNDFDEFISLGVLPQNIFAFEYKRNTYLHALNSINSSDYMQPKLVKASIERYFESTPRKFDIVYIDTCASLVSDHHSLRCISSMFKYHRLNSPGILITNFAFFDQMNETDTNEYVDMLARYFFIKENRKASLIEKESDIQFSDGFELQKEDVKCNLEQFYGDFITAMICNSGSISIPTLRFANSNYLQYLSTTMPISDRQYDYVSVNTIQDNTLYKFLASNRFLEQQKAEHVGVCKSNKLIRELSASESGFDLLTCLRKLHDIRVHSDTLCSDLNETINFFDNDNCMYQFLDKPNRMLFFDSVINQFSYPMHYVSDKTVRLTYVAKQKRMFTDMIVFDECRYIYDWLPAIHQIPKAFVNRSWQYVFRFALDGLIKQRLNYNNEFFFQGSVISKTTDGFKSKTMAERKMIN